MTLTATLMRQGRATHTFTPGDHIELVVQSSETSSFVVQILDTKGNPRYHGFNTGTTAKFRTVVPYTTVFGTWIARITRKLDGEMLELPFDFLPEIMPTVPSLEAAVIPSDGAPWVQLVDSEVVEPSLGEIKELRVSVRELKGVGPAYQKRLKAHSVESTSQMLHYNAELLAQMTNARHTVCREWLHEAKQIQEDPKYLLRAEAPMAGAASTATGLAGGPQFDLTSVKGIGPATAKKLEAVGITSASQLAQMAPEELAASTSFSAKRSKTFIQNAAMLASTPEAALAIGDQATRPPSELTDLTLVKGVGPATAKKMRAVGINTPVDLATAETEMVADAVRCSRSRATVFQENAMLAMAAHNQDSVIKLLDQFQHETPESPFTKLIQAYKDNEITLDACIQQYSETKYAHVGAHEPTKKAGTPAVAAPDDLTSIAGIGPKTAAKLNQAGISTIPELARSDPDQLAADCRIGKNRLVKWIAAAAVAAAAAAAEHAS